MYKRLTSSLVFAFAALLAAFAIQAQASSMAEWTVMVFMNGDNNLENDAISNFLQMAAVGSTDKVNIVTQFDRIPGYSSAFGDWTQTLRFKIEKDKGPWPTNAVEDIGEADMGNQTTLSNFVTWAKAKYPSKKTMLIIWDHGSGWRFQMAEAVMRTSPIYSALTKSAELRTAGIKPKPPRESTYRCVSYDDTSGTKLYVRAIQDALGSSNIDLIGFDACLMSMVETAYALRNAAKVMVASEELEPGPGWEYDDWLRTVVANPAMTPEDLGKVLVESYKQTYQSNDDTTTLATVSLVAINDLTSKLDALSDELTNKLAAEYTSICLARDDCSVYAPNESYGGIGYFQHIDLDRFCHQLALRSHDNGVQKKATEVSSAIHKCVLSNYAGDARQGNFGSSGLAIYFPRTQAIYDADPLAEKGYEKDNQLYPVEFVQTHRWADFLHAFLAKTVTGASPGAH